MKTKSSKLIELISLKTFGIYLFHCSINYKIYFSSKMLNIFAINGYLRIFILEIMYFVIYGVFIYTKKNSISKKIFINL